MSHISGVLNLQTRARRNALQATRELRARRDIQDQVDQALRAAAAVSPDALVNENDAGSWCPQQR